MPPCLHDFNAFSLDRWQVCAAHHQLACCAGFRMLGDGTQVFSANRIFSAVTSFCMVALLGLLFSSLIFNTYHVLPLMCI